MDVEIILIVPIIVCFLWLTIGRSKDSLCTILSATLAGGLSLYLTKYLVAIQGASNILCREFSISPVFRLKATYTTTYFVAMVSALWCLLLIYNLGYFKIKKEVKSLSNFNFWFNISIFFVFALSFSSNLLTMFISYEMLTLCTIPLVACKGDVTSLGAAKKYFIYLCAPSVILMLPLVIYFNGADFSDGGTLPSTTPNLHVFFITLCFVYAIAKTAVFPLHKWLPIAMIAPSPVSAMLHAVVVVKGGCIAMLKVLTGIIGIEKVSSTPQIGWLAIFCGLSAIIAGVGAIRSKEIKKMLAYSTAAQLSYIVGTMLIGATSASLAHTTVHAFAKMGLFMCAGAIYQFTGKTTTAQMVGIGKIAPITAVCFLLFSLSIVGIPYTPGAFSKHMIVENAISSHSVAFAALLIAGSIMNLMYIAPFAQKAFFSRTNAKFFESTYSSHKMRLAEFAMLAPIVCLAIVLFNIENFISLIL